MTRKPIEIDEIMGAPKLIKHLDRMLELKTTGATRPIQIGIDLTNTCNHRCPMCNGSMGQDNTTISYEDLERMSEQFADMGVKAMVLGGGGDASCHPRFADVLRLFKSRGLEIGLFTNGQTLKQNAIEAIIDCCTWARVSLDADTPELFEKTHGVKGESFLLVQESIKKLVARRKETGSEIVLGTSYLIGSHTISGIYGASKLARDLGADFIRMRPYFTWNGQRPFKREEADKVLLELKKCQSLDSDAFKVSYPGDRTEWARDDELKPNPPGCLIHHFSTIVEADQSVYLCCHTKGMEKYSLGNLKRQSFKEIWESARRKGVYENIDWKDCAVPCRDAANNKFLLDALSDVAHKNFIS